MRVISGIFKGKKISLPSDKITRPLKDITKESIFNILIHSNKFSIEIKNSLILDLFSGVGSFGIECISRGAQYVTFVENYNEVLKILRKNLSELKINDVYEIIEKDIIQDLNFQKFKNKFNIIFLDPPYKNKSLPDILDNILKNRILSKDGVIILHRHVEENEKYPENFKILEKKKYGISKIIFGCQN
tara:strand:- start:175 stop:738 length:564 start_codon:yes stop_codon:yes gene_type:complete